MIKHAAFSISIVLCSTICNGESLTASAQNWQKHYRHQINHNLSTHLGEFQLCIAIPTRWNRQTWFYFHGAGGNVHSWKNFADNLYKYHHGPDYPNIIGISLGPKWFLINQSGSSEYDGSALFWDTVMPRTKAVVNEIGQTIAIGHSMGGFNALSLFLDNPDRWNKIVLMTPAVADLSPYASEKEIREYLVRSGVYDWKMMIKTIILGQSIREHGIETILNNWRGIAKDDRGWSLINPLARAGRLKHSGATRFFLSCGKNDPFGFSDGTATANDLLRKAGYSTELHLIRGGHMAIPYRDVYKWLFKK